LSFGVNVSCIAFDALKSARLREKSMYEKLSPFLRLELARGSLTLNFDTPFDVGSLKDAKALVHFLAQNMRTERETCIL